MFCYSRFLTRYICLFLFRFNLFFLFIFCYSTVNTCVTSYINKLNNYHQDEHTFINHRHFEGDADDAHQVRRGNQRAQDGSDT